MLEPTNFDYFTQILRDLAKACGLEVALKVAATWGGRYLYIPMQPSQRIIDAVGEAGANWLSQNYGGQDIEIPMGPYSRNATITRHIRLLAGNKSVPEIAAEVGVNIRTVRRHLSRMRRV